MIQIRITELIWLDSVIEKLHKKHDVAVSEVEEMLRNNPKFKRGPKGNYIEAHIYYALGRTDTNRFLFVVFIFKKDNKALILSAREMDKKEKSLFKRL